MYFVILGHFELSFLVVRFLVLLNMVLTSNYDHNSFQCQGPNLVVTYFKIQESRVTGFIELCRRQDETAGFLARCQKQQATPLVSFESNARMQNANKPGNPCPYIFTQDPNFIITNYKVRVLNIYLRPKAFQSIPQILKIGH